MILNQILQFDCGLIFNIALYSMILFIAITANDLILFIHEWLRSPLNYTSGMLFSLSMLIVIRRMLASLSVWKLLSLNDVPALRSEFWLTGCLILKMRVDRLSPLYAIFIRPKKKARSLRRRKFFDHFIKKWETQKHLLFLLTTQGNQ